MLLYLDARDIISIFERRTPIDPDRFEEDLRASGHFLVLSASVVFELGAPLVHPRAKSNVMSLLNRIERTPHRYINEACIAPLEYQECIRAFSAGEAACRLIDPFVQRFDEAVVIDRAPATRGFLKHGLAETVFTLWTEDPGIFRSLRTQGAQLRQSVLADRRISSPPTRARSLRTTVDRDLRLYRLAPPPQGTEVMADWILEDPTRCPSATLMHALYHAIRRNTTDGVEVSTMADLLHTRSLPYVDAMTLDRRIVSYVRQVSRLLRVDWRRKIFESLERMLRLVGVNTQSVG